MHKTFISTAHDKIIVICQHCSHTSSRLQKEQILELYINVSDNKCSLLLPIKTTI